MRIREKKENKGSRCFFSIKRRLEEVKNLMKKIKPILPSLRERKRYLAFEILSNRQIKEFKLVSDAISSSMLRFIGELGMADAGLLFLDDKFKDQKGIIRVNHRYVDELKSALAMVEEIDNQKVLLRSLGLSGILKKAETKFLAA